jgi:uncharacterized membrane protein
MTPNKIKSILSNIKSGSDSGQHSGYSLKNIETFWLIPIILLAAYLRFYLLDDHPLNDDENEIVNRAVDMTRLLETGNAFLYYPLLQVWINIFGQSVFAVRLPAALVGVVTVPLIYKVGKLLLGQKIGLISALLFSISILHIYYSQQAHSYALFAFLSLLSFYYLWQAIRHNRRYYWLLFGLSVGLSINVHLYSFFVLLSELIIGVILILSKTPIRSLQSALNKKMGLNIIISIGLMILTMLPVLIQYALPQLLQVAGLLPKTGKRLVREGMVQFDISPDSFAWTLRELTIWGFPDGISLLPNSHLLYDIYLLAFLIGLIYLALKKPKMGVILLLWLLIPLLPAAVLARAAGITFATRRLIFILPIYLIIVAIGFKEIMAQLATLKFTYRPLVFALSLVLLVGVFGGFSLKALQWYYEDGKEAAGFFKWRDAAFLLNKVVQAGDIVITSESYLSNYYHGPEQTILFVPEEDLTLALFKNVYTAHPRLWYVRAEVKDDHLKEIKQWLDENNFLTFRFAEQDFLISYKRNDVSSEEVMLAEWIDILRQALEIRSRPYLYETLGNVYIRGGYYQEAITFYQQILADNPQDTSAHAGLAKVYEASGQHNEAMAQIEQAIAIAPGNLQIYQTLAYIHTSQGGTDQAFQEIYHRIEAIDPGAAHFVQALFYVNQGQQTAAIDEFQRVIEIQRDPQLIRQAEKFLDNLR